MLPIRTALTEFWSATLKIRCVFSTEQGGKVVSCLRIHSDLCSEDFRHACILTVQWREWDTQNKQLSPISWQFIPRYLLLKKIPFPCRANGEKILDKNIRRCPQLAVRKGRASDEGPRQQCKQRRQTPRRDRPGMGESPCCHSCCSKCSWPTPTPPGLPRWQVKQSCSPAGLQVSDPKHRFCILE